jgi:hypothetical protein
MPKSPILSREIFYDVLGDGSYRWIDWALVGTELGAMVEANVEGVISGVGPVTNMDMVDISFTKISKFDEGKFIDTFSTGGYLFPKDYTYDTYPIKPAKH